MYDLYCFCVKNVYQNNFPVPCDSHNTFFVLRNETVYWKQAPDLRSKQLPMVDCRLTASSPLIVQYAQGEPISLLYVTAMLNIVWITTAGVSDRKYKFVEDSLLFRCVKFLWGKKNEMYIPYWTVSMYVILCTGILNVFNYKSLLVFWVVMPCGFIDINQHFEGIYCLHRQGFYTFYSVEPGCSLDGISRWTS